MLYIINYIIKIRSYVTLSFCLLFLITDNLISILLLLLLLLLLPLSLLFYCYNYNYIIIFYIIFILFFYYGFIFISFFCYGFIYLFIYYYEVGFLGFFRGHRCTVSTFVFTHLNISCKAGHKLHNNK